MIQGNAKNRQSSRKVGFQPPTHGSVYVSWREELRAEQAGLPPQHRKQLLLRNR